MVIHGGYMEEVIKRHNHFVPEMYLNNWAKEKKIYTYKLLVSHENVPLWKRSAVKNTATIDNLYVRSFSGKEIDDFENVFMREYETPAKEPFMKACSDRCLSEDDWHILINYVAAQIVRTPAFFCSMKNRMVRSVPYILDSIGHKLATVTPEQIKQHHYEKTVADELIPATISLTGVKPDDEHQYVEIKTVIGKSFWLYSIEHLLSNTASILLKHKWSVISAADGVRWPTSDDPVICLNYYGPNNYDFGGGWATLGSVIIMPINPTKALYTKVGEEHPSRMAFTREQSLLIKRIIVEHAFLSVYTSEQDDEIPTIRSRTVDPIEYERIKKEFDEWYDKYQEEEVPLLDNHLSKSDHAPENNHMEESSQNVKSSF